MIRDFNYSILFARDLPFERKMEAEVCVVVPVAELAVLLYIMPPLSADCVCVLFLKVLFLLY